MIDRQKHAVNASLGPRNALSHARAISTLDYERVVCYSADVLESLKAFYAQQARGREYDVPTIVRFVDSFGNERFWGLGEKKDRVLSLRSDSRSHLRPGDRLWIEVEVDPAFPPTEYLVSWCQPSPLSTVGEGLRLEFDVAVRHVGEDFLVVCEVVSTKDWHRYTYWDDRLSILYRVLPPME